MIANETTLPKIMITHKLPTIGEQSSSHIVSYKRTRNDKCETIQTRKPTALLMYKK